MVINCETREVILAAKDCLLVALSYVWDQLPQPEPAAGTDELRTLLRTVEDSITVTRNLGHRYPWADKYVGYKCPFYPRQTNKQSASIKQTRNTSTTRFNRWAQYMQQRR
jgi:hypothetical protein